MKINIPVLDGSYLLSELNPTPGSYKPQKTNVITVRPVAGTLTGGTITVTCKPPGSDVYEEFADNAIDLAAPKRLEINGKVEDFKLDTLSVLGTAVEIQVTIDVYDAPEV